MSGQNSSPGPPWQRHLHNKSYSSSNSSSISQYPAPAARPNSKSISSTTPDTLTRRPQNGSPTRSTTSTFAPTFIRTVDPSPFGRRRSGTLDSKYGGEPSSTTLIGGADFSGKRFVWVKDPNVAFIKAEVIEDDNGMLTVRCEDGNVRSPIPCRPKMSQTENYFRRDLYMWIMSIKSTQQNSTKPMIWLSSPTWTRPRSYTTYIWDIQQTLSMFVPLSDILSGSPSDLYIDVFRSVFSDSESVLYLAYLRKRLRWNV